METFKNSFHSNHRLKLSSFGRRNDWFYRISFWGSETILESDSGDDFTAY